MVSRVAGSLVQHLETLLKEAEAAEKSGVLASKLCSQVEYH